MPYFALHCTLITPYFWSFIITLTMSPFIFYPTRIPQPFFHLLKWAFPNQWLQITISPTSAVTKLQIVLWLYLATHLISFLLILFLWFYYNKEYFGDSQAIYCKYTVELRSDFKQLCSKHIILNSSIFLFWLFNWLQILISYFKFKVLCDQFLRIFC